MEKGTERIQQTDKINAKLELISELKKMSEEIYSTAKKNKGSQYLDYLDGLIVSNSMLKLKLSSMELDLINQREDIFKRNSDLKL